LASAGVWWALALAVIAGCGQDSAQNRSDANSHLDVPMAARLKSVPSCDTDLKADVIVDGGSPIPLAVNCVAGTVSGTIPGLSPGTHTFELQFMYRGVLVATAKTNGDIVSGQNTSVAFAPNALSFPDLDDDGWTNLAELIANTNHQLWSSYPPSSNRRGSITYTLTDSVGLPVAGVAPTGNTSSVQNNLIVHAPVVGTASSARYTDTPGRVPINR
jgi:hypothetical protein